ncbi:MAG: DUF5309 family protein [Alistipes sp.]|nr:DUF5309 family protein [Alistipes sp.]
MKRKTIFTFVVVAIAATVCFALDYFLGTDGILGGASMAFAAFVGATAESTQTSEGDKNQVATNTVAGGKVTGHPEMNKATVSKKLAKVMPSNYPLDTMLREITSGTTNSDKYEFYSIVARGVKAKLGAAVSTAETGGAPVTLTLSEGVHSLSLDGDLLVPSYNVSVSGTTATATKVTGLASRPLQLHIVGISYGNKTVSVIGVNAPCPTLVKDTELYRMASAKDQDAAISNDPMATPTKDFNYCQRNLCTISENAYQALQDKEVDYGMAEFKEQAIYDFRYQNEITAIFGSAYYGGEMVDPNTQKRKLHMRGLLDFGIKTLSREDGVGVAEFLNTAMQEIFSNNNGSEKRILLYGPEFATELANSGAWAKQLEAGKTEVKWGITWKVIESNFGTVLGMLHNGLGMVGYGKAAVLIDPANIRRIEQVPLSMQDLDLKKAGIRNSKDVLMEEAWTLEVTNPATHAMLYM